MSDLSDLGILDVLAIVPMAFLFVATTYYILSGTLLRNFASFWLLVIVCYALFGGLRYLSGRVGNESASA